MGNAYVTQLLDIYSVISYITDEESPIEIKNNTSTSNGDVYKRQDLLGTLDPVK